MNALSRSVLTLYSYDKDPDNIELENVLRQCINLISVFPLLSVYAYQAYNHYERGESLISISLKRSFPQLRISCVC